MDYLNEFERCIEPYDGMLIETGGAFGRGKLGGDKYVEKCFGIAKNHMLDKGSKNDLLNILQKYIEQYEEETEWKYYDLEMNFLYELKEKIGTL